MFIYNANSLLFFFIALFLLSKYFTTISALSWHVPSFRDYEYPELQLLLTARDETNNSKDEETNSPKLNFKTVNGGASNNEDQVYDPFSTRKNSESPSDNRPWMKSRFLDGNKYSPKTQLEESSKNSFKLRPDNPIYEAKEKEKGTSVSHQEQVLTDNASVIKHLKYNELQMEDVSREREQKRSPDDSISNQKIKSVEIKESSFNQNLKSSKTGESMNNNKLYNEFQRNAMPERGSMQQIDDGNSKAVSSSGTEFVKRRGPEDQPDEVKNAEPIFFNRKQIKINHGKQFNGRSSRRATGHETLDFLSKENVTLLYNFDNNDSGENLLRQVSSRNHLAEKMNSSGEKNHADVMKHYYNKNLVEARKGQDNVFPLVDSEVTSNAETRIPIKGKYLIPISGSTYGSKPMRESLSSIATPSLRNNSFLMMKPTSCNLAIPLIYPIPETDYLNTPTQKIHKTNAISSDIVAHVPIKLLGQADSKAGKSLANNLPLPEQRNPLANIEIDIKKQEKQEFKEDSETTDISVLPPKKNIETATISANRIKEQYHKEEGDSSFRKGDSLITKPNKDEIDKEKHILLKKSLNTFKRNKFENGSNKDEKNLGFQDDRFHSLTSNEAPSVKLSALFYKVKDKRNLMNLMKNKKVNRTSFGMKRSIGDQDSFYDEYYSNPKLEPPSEDYEYDDEDDYGQENKNFGTFSKAEPQKRYRSHYKQLRPKGNSDEYYFYVDQSNYQADNRNKNNRSTATFVSKYSDNVFAHPLAIDDPELEIINDNREIKKTHPHKKLSRLFNRRKIKNREALKKTGYKGLYSEQERKLMYPGTYSHLKKGTEDIIPLKPQSMHKLNQQMKML